MAGRPGIDAVVVGASAGGIEALERLVAGLPPGLPVPVLVVVHVAAGGVSVLPRILGRAGPLPAGHARHGEATVPGRIYVAPPDHHLLAADGTVALSRGPRENGHRPAVDVLFRSAAVTFGPRVAAVVLSGSLDDGAAGLAAVKAAGGVALVQDPADAAHPGMPRSALDRVAPDHVLPAAAIAGALAGLAAGAGGDPAGAAGSAGVVGAPAPARPTDAGGDPGADPAVRAGLELGCPDCGGVLRPHEADGVLRCRVGHAWASRSLLAAQSGRIEEALWVALRTLEERAELTGAVAAAARQRNHAITAGVLEERARRLDELVGTLRSVLDAGAAAMEADPEAGAGAEAG